MRVPVEAMGSAALVIAHPGHELRVHGWMARTRPVVFVLTDGSGRTGRSRIESTTRVLAALGAARGAVYGRFSDREIYRALMERETARFVALASEIAAAFATLATAEVAGDALEGYNPTHDLCRHLIDAAVGMSRASGREITNYDFPLTGPPDAGARSDAVQGPSWHDGWVAQGERQRAANGTGLGFRSPTRVRNAADRRHRDRMAHRDRRT